MATISAHRKNSVLQRFLGSNPKLYDLLAASPLIIWCFLSLTVQWSDVVRDLTALGSLKLQLLGTLDLVSRVLRFMFAGILGTFLIIRRTPIQRHEGFIVRIIALFGSYGGVGAQLLPVNPALSAWLLPSTVLTIGGISFAIYSLLWLGRSISVLPESRKLVTGGPYSIVRHPLYTGEQAAIVGIAFQSGSLWVATILLIQTACQICRIGYEEKVLNETFPEYAEYRAKTASLIPFVY